MYISTRVGGKPAAKVGYEDVIMYSIHPADSRPGLLSRIRRPDHSSKGLR